MPAMTMEDDAVPRESLALMLGGGGARGAYQAGVLRGIARRCPQFDVRIFTGISAGAINTAFLASRAGTLAQATDDLVALWRDITPESVYDVRALPLMRNVAGWGLRLMSGGMTRSREPLRGMVDTEPLRSFLSTHLAPGADGALPGIARNVARGALDAVALSATSYATGQSITWVQGKDIHPWQRPQRRSESVQLGTGHVMASCALPMLFPAVQVGAQWFGDGGIRLTTPLSPALHLGATRIITVSTRYARTRTEADLAQTVSYPPPAQVLGVLYNAVFLDLIDEDILRLQRVNKLLACLPPDQRHGMRVVDILVIRPSCDLGRLSREFEARMPAVLRYLTRGLGTTRTASPDFISLIMFQPDYLRRLIELGEADAEAHGDRIDAFLERQPLALAAGA